MAKSKKPKKTGKGKKNKSELKKPSKKNAKLKAAAKASAKQAVSKKPAKTKKKVAVPTGEIDLSTVMISEAFRRQVCRELKLSPRETGYVTKVVNSVYRAVGILQGDPIANSDSPLLAGRLGKIGEIDLDILIKVSESRELQEEVHRACRDASFIGPVGVSSLKMLVQKAKEIVLARESDTSAG